MNQFRSENYRKALVKAQNQNPPPVDLLPEQIAAGMGCIDSTATNYNPDATSGCDSCCTYDNASPIPPTADPNYVNVIPPDTIPGTLKPNP